MNTLPARFTSFSTVLSENPRDKHSHPREKQTSFDLCSLTEGNTNNSLCSPPALQLEGESRYSEIYSRWFRERIRESDGYLIDRTESAFSA